MDYFRDPLSSTPQQDSLFMRQALEEARTAFEADEVPIGAVVVCRGQIIARSHNHVERLTDATAHAEMQAITMTSHTLGGKFLTDCTLYVTVEPCPMCMGALRWSRIGRVVFGAYDPKGGYQTFAPSLPHPKTIVQGGILEEECATLMRHFFARKR